MFFFTLLLGFAFLFWNIAKGFSGKLKYIIPTFFVGGTLLGFFLREITLFSAAQTFFLIFTCIALSIYIIFDILSLILRLLRHPLKSQKSKQVRGIIFFAALAITIIFLSFGIPHNNHYKIRTARIPLKENTPAFSVAFFTDLHLDPLFNKSKLKQFAEDLDSLQPDYIFFGGDFADMKDSALSENGFDTLMQAITAKAKKGAFGVLGNHEAYVENEDSNPGQWMEKIGLKILIDTTICNENFCLTGRQDFQIAKRNEMERKPLEVLKPKNSKLPWLLLDHQPHGIEEAYQGEFPLLALSGHTHNGQFFPGTILIDLIWPLSYGFGSINGANWLVSSGIDSWGPPVRVGSDTEFWFLTFKH